MKIGDLVRFKRAHAIQPGYEYCAPWMGIVTRYSREPLTGIVMIHWTSPDHGIFQAEYEVNDELLEVVSEGR